MTLDKTPTDAQLQSAYDSVPAHGNQQDVHIAGLRAVLAKWGTPAPAGVDPVGEIRASSELGVAPYADIWPWLQPGTKLYTADQVQAADSVLEEAARWEFRWLNPANKQNVAPSELAWKTVNSKGMLSEKEVLEDLKTYRYQGKPVYELRPLFATRALQKPEIRCPVRLANGGDCPRHNLQCGWPDCNKETK